MEVNRWQDTYHADPSLAVKGDERGVVHVLVR